MNWAPAFCSEPAPHVFPFVPFQGPKTWKELELQAVPFSCSPPDTVLLTHAHIDHSGLRPKLVRNGFAGRILATRGTIDLCPHVGRTLVLHPGVAGRVPNRRNAARGRAGSQPIYTQAPRCIGSPAYRSG